MQTIGRYSFITLLILVSVTCARANLPQTINYQGYLKNTDGTPVSIATSVRFSLYSSNPPRNNPLWRETKSITPSNGIYSTQLGSVTPITAAFDVPYWLGIKVAGDGEMALQTLSSVPYAFRAAAADSAANASSAATIAGQTLTNLDSRYIDSAQPKATVSQLATLRWDQVGTGVSGTYAVGSNPAGILFDGSSIWVASYTGSNSLAKVNPATAAVVGNYVVAGSHVGLAFDGSSIWVTNKNNNSVSKVNPSTGAVIGTYAVGTTPWGIAFDGTSIWVANSDSLSVTKINPVSGAILGTYNVGNNPRYIAFDGTHIWVTNNGSNSVTKLNTAGAALGTYTVGAMPEGVAYDGTSIWVANWGSSSVTKLNPTSGAVLGTYTVGTGPVGLVFDGTSIWVGNYSGNSLTKLNPNTGAVLGSFATGTNPWGLAFDGANIWAVNWGSSNLTKLANVGVQVGAQTVGTAQLATAAVSTSLLADTAVATAKLADGAVTGTKLANGSVVSAKLADGSVTSAKLAGGAVTSAKINLDGDVSLNHNDLKLLYGDTNHGVGWYGAGKLFSGANVDGPALYGYSGGALGTTNGGQKIALSWDSSGNVTLPGNLQYAAPKTRRWSVSGCNFNPMSGGATFDTNALRLMSTTSSFSAPVHLPDGAVVTKLTVYYLDNDAADDFEVGLYRNMLSGTNERMVRIVTSGSNAGYRSTAETIITSPTIENGQNAYVLSLVGMNGATTHVLEGVVLEYTIIEPVP